MSTGREIRLVEEDDGWWSAIDEETGVASQGETREAALQSIAEQCGADAFREWCRWIDEYR